MEVNRWKSHILHGSNYGDTVNFSPKATGGIVNSSLRNIADGQNVTESVTFESDVELSAMDVYTNFGTGVAAGFGVTVRVWQDDTGSPGPIIYESQESLLFVDFEGIGTASNWARHHVDLSLPVRLNSQSTYWIGMSGTSEEFGQGMLDGVAPPGDGSAYKMIGTTAQVLLTANGDMSFRLYGNSVPQGE